MIAPAIFHWIVLPGVADAATQGKRVQAFANVTQMCENTHPSIEMSSEEDEDIGESF